MSQREHHEPSPDQHPDEQPDQGRFQGGAGGPESNTGVFADTEPYGGPQDQLGYGSTPDDGAPPTDPQHPKDGQQDKDKAVTSVGAGPGGSMGGTADGA